MRYALLPCATALLLSACGTTSAGNVSEADVRTQAGALEKATDQAVIAQANSIAPPPTSGINVQGAPPR
jgi:hypothetical protein